MEIKKFGRSQEVRSDQIPLEMVRPCRQCMTGTSPVSLSLSRFTLLIRHQQKCTHTNDTCASLYDGYPPDSVPATMQAYTRDDDDSTIKGYFLYSFHLTIYISAKEERLAKRHHPAVSPVKASRRNRTPVPVGDPTDSHLPPAIEAPPSTVDRRQR